MDTFNKGNKCKERGRNKAPLHYSLATLQKCLLTPTTPTQLNIGEVKNNFFMLMLLRPRVPPRRSGIIMVEVLADYC